MRKEGEKRHLAWRHYPQTSKIAQNKNRTFPANKEPVKISI